MQYAAGVIELAFIRNTLEKTNVESQLVCAAMEVSKRAQEWRVERAGIIPHSTVVPWIFTKGSPTPVCHSWGDCAKKHTRRYVSRA